MGTLKITCSIFYLLLVYFAASGKGENAMGVAENTKSGIESSPKIVINMPSMTGQNQTNVPLMIDFSNYSEIIKAFALSNSSNSTVKILCIPYKTDLNVSTQANSSVPELCTPVLTNSEVSKSVTPKVEVTTPKPNTLPKIYFIIPPVMNNTTSTTPKPIDPLIYIVRPPQTLPTLRPITPQQQFTTRHQYPVTEKTQYYPTPFYPRNPSQFPTPNRHYPDPMIPTPFRPQNPPINPFYPPTFRPHLPFPHPQYPFPVQPRNPIPINPIYPPTIRPQYPHPVKPHNPYPVTPQRYPTPNLPSYPHPRNPSYPSPMNPQYPSPFRPQQPYPRTPRYPSPMRPQHRMQRNSQYRSSKRRSF